MTTFYLAYDEGKPDDEAFATLEMTKRQAAVLVGLTREAIGRIKPDAAVMWQMNFQAADYLSLEDAGDLTAEQYRRAAAVVLDACASDSELKDLYVPLKTLFGADSRFQAA